MPAEATKHDRRDEVALKDDTISHVADGNIELSPPPSRVLRSGKRVPVGTAVKVPTHTTSKAGRVAVSSAEELRTSQVSGGAKASRQAEWL